jgi:hypothetical protein
MENSTSMAVTVGASIGVLIWMLSPAFIGTVEPWNTGSYYALALLGSGIVAGAFIPKNLGILYVSVVGGQIAYAYLIQHASSLAGMGMGTLLLYTLIFLGGAVFGSRLQSIF